MVSSKKDLQFFICFGGLLLLDASLSHFNFSSYRYATKPLIMISLMAYFISKKSLISKKLYPWGIFAIIAALAGDIFLMFQEYSGLFFIAGLGAFLFAHIGYTIIFLTQKGRKKHLFQFILLANYALIMGYLILPKAGDLKIPVLVYIMAISAMAYTAQIRKGTVSNASYITGLIGARLFLASDSLLALSMFLDAFPKVDFLIMLSYGIAQACMVYSLVNSSKINS